MIHLNLISSASYLLQPKGERYYWWYIVTDDFWHASFCPFPLIREGKALY